MTVRAPAVAGTFYPSDPTKLASMIDAMLRNAEVTRPGVPPKAIVVPHAGFVYSGPVAASGYASLVPRPRRVTRVVVIGPAHRVAVDGLALPAANAFATPLGELAIDDELRAKVASHDHVVVDDRAHAGEHSIEVQLPFLQRIIGDFSLLPLVAGRCPAETVANVLELVWGGDETLIVVSSDLSHYENYASATAHDEATAAAIVAAEVEAIGSQDACGVVGLRGLMTLARRQGASLRLLDLRCSGDTSGPRDRVVGYGAFALADAS